MERSKREQSGCHPKGPRDRAVLSADEKIDEGAFGFGILKQISPVLKAGCYDQSFVMRLHGSAQATGVTSEARVLPSGEKERPPAPGPGPTTTFTGVGMPSHVRVRAGGGGHTAERPPRAPKQYGEDRRHSDER